MFLAFDIQKYIFLQKNAIIKKNEETNGKLYFELGGKLFDDYHAARILPGFEPDTKIQMLETLKDKIEIVICINAMDIQNDRIRSDFDILYTEECLRLIKNYRVLGFYVSGIAITVYKNQTKAKKFAELLKSMGENVYFLHYIYNYPNNINNAIESFKLNDFIETTRPLIIMTSPGSGSGKLSACLSQLFKEKSN